jgi:hypothetical protein
MAGALLRWSRSADAPTTANRGSDDGPSILVRSANLGGQLFGPPPLVVDMDRPVTVVEAPQGGPIRIQGSGYAPGTVVVVGVESTPQSLGAMRADADGRISVLVRLPENLADGRHTLTASGLTTDGALQVRPQPVEVGGSLWWPPALWAAVFLLLAGIGWLLLRLDRRRARKRAAAATSNGPGPVPA